MDGFDHLRLIATATMLRPGTLFQFERNDGMVTKDSAYFEGHSIDKQRPLLVGYDHAHMKGDDLSRDDDLFKYLEEDLLELVYGITTEPEQIYAPSNVTLKPTGEFSEGTTYDWIINYDGQELPYPNEDNLSFVFQKPGNYEVTLTAHDPIIGDIIRTKTIPVFEPDIKVSAPNGIDSLNRSVNCPACGGNEQYITKYTWSFGDGETREGRTVNYTYEITGTYTVRLTLTLDDGSTISSDEREFVGPGTIWYPSGFTVPGGRTKTLKVAGSTSLVVILMSQKAQPSLSNRVP